ncbi:MAG: MotA/TolQ/ExbB proton channel family protein [Bacteroidetes bacterium]|nr:MotA/TolQ/ExbB proton channel family protein [Bacteroidota bacterium]
MSLSELHHYGGPPFMLPLDIIGVTNIFLLVYSVYRMLLHQEYRKQLELMRHLGGAALVYGTFGTLVGLFMALKALEELKEALPLAVISGGLKVGLIGILYGFLIYMISLSFYIFLKSYQSNNSQQGS